MSDEMKVQPFEVLLKWVLDEYEENESIFGIHGSLFHTPEPNAPYVAQMFGHHLATPIGPAAGPHTQLTQNILCSWLTGGRFIELKTVQIMDELEIPRPCIDLADEGYNVEWSQELKLDQSAWEYVKAWVLVHVLRRMLGFENIVPFGTIFNMSVGYNLEGIHTAPMQRFMDRMEDASEEIAEIQRALREQFPRYADLEIPTQLTNSVTLSTMHGCPPDEIEQIARYLLEDRGLHTIVKLNPTLLGKETVLHILHEDLGYREIQIPDSVFEHDLKYGRAVEMISVLKQVAARKGLTFGVKLSNTLAMANHRQVLPGDEMYMSGRALYPITMNLFHKLTEEFDGDLNVSYSAGADALNVATILSAGALPVTAASDLLKPGGYARFVQWLEELDAALVHQNATSLDDLQTNRRGHLARAATSALLAPRYKKSYHPIDLPKTGTELEPFDCITAPCVEQCAVCQDVPDYAWLIAHGEYDRALGVILHRNPLPGVTGYVCTHLCQSRCTRSNYDQPVLIRDLKRFASERGKLSDWGAGQSGNGNTSGPRVAIVGSGPSGLAAAYFLGLNGIKSTIFEAREMAGGMLAIAPHFRLPPDVVQADIDRITALGAEIKLNQRITVPPQELLDDGFDAVYIACGFQKDATLNLQGIEGKGVLTALRFLEAVARDEPPPLGSKVLVIGGGNTAMDAARTAQRLTGKPSMVVYRRTQSEMPAEEEELRDLFEEGNELIELASPSRVILKDGQMISLECVRNSLGEPDSDGRRRPLPIEASEFQIEADSLILAIGQKPDIAFLAESGLVFGQGGAVATDTGTRQTSRPGVYAGGDVTRGPAIIIQACEDGRRAAEAICRELGTRESGDWDTERPSFTETDVIEVKRTRARKVAPHDPALLPVGQRAGFDLVELTLTETAAQAEAARCLQCATFCDKCVEVCPNRANYTFQVSPACWSLPLISCQPAVSADQTLTVTGQESFEITQARQILHVDDFCNECGNCATFCVHQGKPYTEKPRLFLRRADFESTKSNAFYIDGDTIWRREGDHEAQLGVRDGAVIFEDHRVQLRLSPDFQIQEMTLKEDFDGQLSLKEAAEMSVVLRGVVESLPHLLTACSLARSVATTPSSGE